MHKPAFRERIQIPDDASSVDSGSSDAQMKKRLSADMSKEQVEELVRKLTIDEMKTKWFDEIFAKVKSERKLSFELVCIVLLTLFFSR